jgi:hypothetical protein
MRKELEELTAMGVDLEDLLLELDFLRRCDFPGETMAYPGCITGY